MNFIVKLALYLALVVFSCTIRTITAEEPNLIELEVKKLKDICANKYVPLTSVKEVQMLIKILDRRPKYCAKKFRQSFLELEPILTLTNRQRICDDDKFDQIVSYHFRFISPKIETYESGDDLQALGREIRRQPLKVHLPDYGVQVDKFNNEIMIPTALQMFFKAWVLQVSGLCKKTLMENLNRAVQENLDKSDISVIGTFVAAGNEPVVDPLSGKKVSDLNFDGIVYMPELEGNIRPELDALREEAVKIDLKKDPELDRFFHACKLRFKPIYSKLVLPVVRLAKLGYDYMGPKLEKAYGVIQNDPEVKAWAAITALCESRGKFELIESEPPIDMKLLDYSPTINFQLDDQLWIKNQGELEKELERIEGSRSTGLKKALYLAGVQGNKFVSLLDPHRSAWFRRNRNVVAISVSSLGFLTSLTNLCLHFTSG